MKMLVTVLVLLLAALAAAAEWAAPRLVEDRVEQRVDENVAGAGEVDADAGTFPFVPRLLLDTEMRRLAVTLTEVTGHELTFTEVTFELTGIHLDRDELFDGEVEVTEIDRGVATVAIDHDALAAVGDIAPEQVQVVGRTLSLGPAGVGDVAVPPQLLPCEPRTETTDEGLRLTCEFHEVPDVLVRAAG